MSEWFFVSVLSKKYIENEEFYVTLRYRKTGTIRNNVSEPVEKGITTIKDLTEKEVADICYAVTKFNYTFLCFIALLF